MKLTKILLISLCLVVIAQGSKHRSRQLFDVVGRESASNSHNKGKAPIHAGKSLFDVPGDRSHASIKHSNPTGKNLFASLNFSQLKEKEQSGHAVASLFGKNQLKAASNNSLFSSMGSNEHLSTDKSATNKVMTNTRTDANLQEKKVNSVSSVASKVSTETQNLKAKNNNNSNHSSIVDLTNKSQVKAHMDAKLQAKSQAATKVSTKTSKVQAKSEMRKSLSRSDRKYQRNLNKNQKEIDKLKKKVTVLLQMNDKLVKKIKKSENIHKKSKKFNRNVESFIQKYDSDVNNLKEHIETSKNLVKNKIVKKDEEFKKLYEETRNRFGNLQSQIQEVGKKVVQFQSEEEKKIKDLHSNFSLNDLKVDGKLNVEGIAFINKVNAKSIDLGSIKLEPEHITVNEATKITVGKETANVGNILNSLAAFKSLISRCGENFEKCQPAPESLLQQQAAKQEEILQKLKALRAETSEILHKKHKKMR